MSFIVILGQETIHIYEVNTKGWTDEDFDNFVDAKYGIDHCVWQAYQKLPAILRTKAKKVKVNEEGEYE